MKTVIAKHLPYNDGRLGDVQDEMEIFGCPTITVMEGDGVFLALTGSHRLAAAHRADREPKLVVEIEDGGLPDHVTYRAVQTLPRYEFDHVEVLFLKDFLK